MINVWTLRLTDIIRDEEKEAAASEIHPGRYLHHQKIGKGYKPMLQGIVDKSDQLKVTSSFIVFNYIQSIIFNYIYIYIYICIRICNTYIHIYIYIEREREKGREREHRQAASDGPIATQQRSPWTSVGDPIPYFITTPSTNGTQ